MSANGQKRTFAELLFDHPVGTRQQRLRDRHRFKTKMDDEARANMFKHPSAKVT